MEKRSPEMTPGQDSGNKAENILGKNSTPVNEMLVGLGAMAEMSHIFYMGMIGAGASLAEAAIGMTAFINATIQHARDGQTGNGDTETDTG